jgi:hypothetical protein
MESETGILTELQGLSPTLAAGRPGHPYKVPETYFALLPGQILDSLQNATVLPVAAAPAFQVPKGYFDNFANSVLAKIQQQTGRDEITAELASVAPMLNTISSRNVYTVPEGYFEQWQFTPPVLQPARLVRLRTARRWMQYAAAAVVAGVLITSAFLFTGEPSFRKYSRMDVPSEIQKLSENDLASYLYNPERLQAVSSQDILLDVKDNIHSMSDEELTGYLVDNPDAEMAIPVSTLSN